VLNTIYISRVFPLGRVEAIGAIEAWHRDLSMATGRRRLAVGHRLRIRPRFEPTGCDPLLLRRLRGTLWVAGWPVAVELELVRYSRCASEIALRPCSIRWPVVTQGYEKNAVRAVEEIVTVLTAGAKTVTESPPEQTEDTTGFAHGLVRPKARGFSPTFFSVK
jgi:hypothetical protein